VNTEEYRFQAIDDTQRDLLFEGYLKWSQYGPAIIKAFTWRETLSPDLRMNNPLGLWRKDALFGTVNTMPAFLFYRGIKLDAAWQVDAMVDSECRGKKLGTEMMRVACEDHDIILQKGISDTMYSLTRRFLGYVDGPNTNMMVAVLRPFYQDVSPIRLLGYFALFIVSTLKRMITSLTTGSVKGLSIETVDHFENSFDQLADISVMQDIMQPRKDSRYLNWRYRDCALRDYIILKATDKDRLRGAIVLKIDEINAKRGWIVDLVSPVDDVPCIEALISTALSTLRHEYGIQNVMVFATSPVARKCLAKYGFIERQRNPRFTYKVMNNDHDIDVSRCEWNLWHGDSDTEVYG